MTARHYLTASAAAIAMIHATTAIAQDTDTTEVPSASTLGDIVVTAQRRSEKLQNVAIAVTVANADQLTAAHITDVSNIAAISPSIKFVAANISTSTSNLVIRGIGTTGNSRSFEGSAGVFIDGVYRTRSAAALSSFNDIDNVQLLRGPQGTLFGKNTTSGALLLTSTKPSTTDFRANYEASYAEYGQIVAKAAVNTPLSEDAAFRIAGVYTHRDGYFTDVNTGHAVNGDETVGVKGQLYVKAGPNLDLRVIADYLHSSGDCCYGTAIYTAGPTLPLVNALAGAAGLKTASLDPSKLETALNRANRQVTKDYGVALEANLSLGSDTLKSISAYRGFKVAQTDTDVDFGPADILSLNEDFSSQFYSQELTYNGNFGGSNVNYVLGAFASTEKVRIHRAISWESQAQAYWNALFAPLPAGTADAASGLYDAETMGGRSTSYAAFAHAEYKFSENWNLIAGLRYSIERKSGFFHYTYYRATPNLISRILGSGPAPAYDAATTDKALSGTLGVQYHPSSRSMLYATYNRGFKAGGVVLDANGAGGRANNPAEVPGGTPLSPIYRPEKVDAFELGAKLDWMGGRARTNAAVFYTRMNQFQVAQFLGLQNRILSANTAKSGGAELETLFNLDSALTLSASMLYLPKADYGVDANIGILSGARIRLAPKFSGNASLDLDRPLVDDLNLTSRLALNYSGSQYVSTASNAHRGDVAIVNFNLGVKAANGTWGIEGWVQNLFDKIYAESVFNTTLQTGSENAYMSAPRTFGITLRGKI